MKPKPVFVFLIVWGALALFVAGVMAGVGKGLVDTPTVPYIEHAKSSFYTAGQQHSLPISALTFAQRFGKGFLQ